MAIYVESTEQYFALIKQLDSLNDAPGDSPPWYFIRRDFLAGVSFGAGLFFCLVIALVLVRWFPESALFVMFFSLLWFSGDIWRSVVIQASCTNLMDPAKATTRWGSFDSYLHDPLIQFARFGLPFFWLLVFFYFSPILRRLDFRRTSLRPATVVV